MTGLPASVRLDGRAWRVGRAWPGADELAVEVAHPASASVRAGTWSAADGFRVAAVGSDDRLPGLAEWAARGDVVSHRPGRRAVVRLADGSGFVKIVRPGRAAGVRRAHDAAQGFEPAFRMPARLPVDADDHVRFGVLDGRTLHDLGADPATDDEAWAAMWRDWAVAWPTAVTADRAVLAVHTVDDEADVLATWAEHAARVVPDAAPALRRRAAHRARDLRAHAGDALVLAHRDLHDKQLLHADGRAPGILDVDTACRADPALDLGNLRAHASFRAAQGVWTARRARVAIDAIDGVAPLLGVTPAGLAAADRATRFRIGCVYLFRPRWRTLARRMLADGA